MKTILLLEDDLSLLKLYTYGLQYAGYRVTPISTLEQLKTQSGDFDLCISDINIVGLSGEAMLETLAQIRDDSGTPVLVVSGSADRYRALCSKLGLYALQKPFINSQLVSTVQDIIGESEVQRS